MRSPLWPVIASPSRWLKPAARRELRQSAPGLNAPQIAPQGHALGPHAGLAIWALVACTGTWGKLCAPARESRLAGSGSTASAPPGPSRSSTLATGLLPGVAGASVRRRRSGPAGRDIRRGRVNPRIRQSYVAVHPSALQTKQGRCIGQRCCNSRLPSRSIWEYACWPPGRQHDQLVEPPKGSPRQAKQKATPCFTHRSPAGRTFGVDSLAHGSTSVPNPVTKTAKTTWERASSLAAC